jgi:hypothetical protein
MLRTWNNNGSGLRKALGTPAPSTDATRYGWDGDIAPSTTNASSGMAILFTPNSASGTQDTCGQTATSPCGFMARTSCSTGWSWRSISVDRCSRGKRFITRTGIGATIGSRTSISGSVRMEWDQPTPTAQHVLASTTRRRKPMRTNQGRASGLFYGVTYATD